MTVPVASIVLGGLALRLLVLHDLAPHPCFRFPELLPDAALYHRLALQVASGAVPLSADALDGDGTSPVATVYPSAAAATRRRSNCLSKRGATHLPAKQLAYRRPSHLPICSSQKRGGVVSEEHETGPAFA